MALGLKEFYVPILLFGNLTGPLSNCSEIKAYLGSFPRHSAYMGKTFKLRSFGSKK